jgi:hypothetical protein
VRLGTVNVDQSGEDGVDGDFGTFDDVANKGGELGVLGATYFRTAPGGRWGWTTHGIIDCFDHIVYKIFQDGS